MDLFLQAVCVSVCWCVYVSLKGRPSNTGFEEDT